MKCWGQEPVFHGLQVALEVVNSESSARLVKARLEKTTLGQVAESISLCLLSSEVAAYFVFHEILVAVSHFLSKSSHAILFSEISSQMMVFGKKICQASSCRHVSE